MLKYELSTALKSKRVTALLCFFLLIVAYDLYSNYMENFGEYLRVGGSKPIKIPLIDNRTGEYLEENQITEALATHLTRPVLFRESLLFTRRQA